MDKIVFNLKPRKTINVKVDGYSPVSVLGKVNQAVGHVDDVKAQIDAKLENFSDNKEQLESEINTKLNSPEVAGADGQVLTSDGMGGSKWEDIPDSYELPQASDTSLGGVKAKARTTESIEVAIDDATGKLYIPGASAGDVPIADVSEHFIATDVEGALSELFTSVSSGKGLIAGAITDKGVLTSANDSFATMANNIANLQSGTPAIVPILHLDGIDNTGLGHDDTATKWKDLTGTVSDATKGSGTTSWGDKFLRVDNNSTWSVPSPNLSKGTFEVVVAIDQNFVPVNTPYWYRASCIFGRELNGDQQDWGILINSQGNFAIGYGNSTIYSSSISALDGLPHTVTYSYFRGPLTFAIDGIVIAQLGMATSGTEITSACIGWNGVESTSRISGNIYGIKWFKEFLDAEQIMSNHLANKTYYGF